MPELELHDLALEEREGYLRSFLPTNTIISDFTFSSLFMWATFYSLKLSYFDEVACVICTGGEFPPSLLMPLGATDNKMYEVINYYSEWFEAHGQEFCISHVEEKFLPSILAVKGYNYNVTYDRNYSDYIYNRSDFVMMDGGDYKGFRKKIRAFENHYPDHEYSKIKKNDIPECMELLELWRKQKGYDADSFETAKLLENYDTLKLIGAVVRLKGKIQAFLLGEIYGDTGFIISGKADMEIHGLYLYAVREFVKSEFSGVHYVNRCEGSWH